MFVADHRKLLYLYPCGKENRKDASMSSHFIWKNQMTKKKDTAELKHSFIPVLPNTSKSLNLFLLGR